MPIINDVEVKECQYYEYQTKEDYEMRIPESGYCNIGLCAYMFNCNSLIDDLEKHCIDNPNCQYKQLQRLKKENEELKKQIDLDAECIANYMKNATNLKKENEELKDKAYKDADMIYVLNETIHEFEVDLNIEKAAHKCDIETLDKYHKALEEIREICKRTFAVCDDDCGNANKIADIITKIDEVLR